MLVISACQGEPPDDLLASRWLDAMNAHRVEQVLALLDEHVTFSDPGTKTPLDREGLAEHLRMEWSVWKDQVYTATHVHRAADSTVIEWRVQQTHPDGKHMELDGVTVLETKAGRVSALRTYFNPVIFLQFLPKTPGESR